MKNARGFRDFFSFSSSLLLFFFFFFFHFNFLNALRESGTLPMHFTWVLSIFQMLYSRCNHN